MEKGEPIKTSVFFFRDFYIGYNRKEVLIMKDFLLDNFDNIFIGVCSIILLAVGFEWGFLIGRFDV